MGDDVCSIVHSLYLSYALISMVCMMPFKHTDACVFYIKKMKIEICNEYSNIL